MRNVRLAHNERDAGSKIDCHVALRAPRNDVAISVIALRAPRNDDGGTTFRHCEPKAKHSGVPVIASEAKQSTP